MNFQKKIVLITGASRGIGAAIAKLLLKNNYYIIIHYNMNEAAALAIANQYPKQSLILKSDFTKDNDPSELWRQALEWKGKINVLINNAAIMLNLSDTHNIKEQHNAWDVTYRVNVRAVADLCGLAIEHFHKIKGGIILNMASRASFRGDMPNFMNYAASKGAIISLTRTIARGYAKDNILAYSIAPGLVDTDMAEDFINKIGREKLMNDIPIGELVPTEEVAELALLIASGKIRHATGANFDINGASYVR